MNNCFCPCYPGTSRAIIKTAGAASTGFDHHGSVRVCVCACIQGWEGNFLGDERLAKNTMHYHPLQAISFPTTLLSETILFIDGKINHQKEGGREHEINDASAQSIQISKGRKMWGDLWSDIHT